MENKLKVGILGATGAVGQRFVTLLNAHPWFEVSALLASPRSAGKRYAEAANWFGSEPLPRQIGEMEVTDAAEFADVDFVFSGMDAAVAGQIELSWAQHGIPVISNARNFRMEQNVPLLIPEVNPDHIGLIDRQEYSEDGFIVTNPNCSTIGLVSALKPLHDAFGLKAVHVTTLQALSGAGYPGVSSLDILGNVVPHIGGEEEKIESEPLKLFGTLTENGLDMLDVPISAQCNRVPVIDGHTLSISVRLGDNPDVDAVTNAFRSFESPLRALNLPSSPSEFIHVVDDGLGPQPTRHVNYGTGMTISVGKIRPCPNFGIRFVALVHNTIRGAAGGAILNAEYLVRKYYLGSQV